MSGYMTRQEAEKRELERLLEKIAVMGEDEIDALLQDENRYPCGDESSGLIRNACFRRLEKLRVLEQGCACPSNDAFDCWVRRYPDTESTRAEGGPCICACHENEDGGDWWE